MATKASSVRSLAFFLGLTFLALQLPIPAAHAEDQMGQLTVTGMVKVNEKPAATGDIVASGGAVETAAHSSAVVSLGKLGRVEALPETKMTLRYSASGISVLLEAGSVRVQTGEGVSASVSYKK